MADRHPLKFVLDGSGEVVAVAEFDSGDTIPSRYLNLSAEIDGGAITDTFSHLMENIDGGQFTDTFTEDMVEYKGGTI